MKIVRIVFALGLIAVASSATAQIKKVLADKRTKWRSLDPRKKLYQQARNRAKRYNMDFDLAVNDIVIPEKCPLLDIPFIVGEKNNYQFSYSLDRKDNSKGYTKDNIWVISVKANSMKNNATREELRTFCQNVLKNDDIVRTYE
mgnify:CR=1 FL=1